MADREYIRQHVFDNAIRQISLLQRGLEISLEDLETFQEWVTDQLVRLGASTEEFIISPTELKEQPAFNVRLDNRPESIQFGTNVLGRLSGRLEATTLLFAHADKSIDSYQYTEKSIDFDDDRLVGPGIADDVCGVVAMLGAIDTLTTGGWTPETSVVLASVLGKQLGVGGTYGLMRRIAPADAAVYIHPAESGRGLSDLKVGSNGLYHCTITLRGKLPSTSETHHPLYVEHGSNPVDVAVSVVQQLHSWIESLAESYAHPGVERAAGTSAGMVTSDIRVADSDRSVYEMPQECDIEVAIAFPPGITLERVADGVRNVVAEAVEETDLTHVAVQDGDLMAESAETAVSSPAVRTVTHAIDEVAGQPPNFYYGHTASDIRYPLLHWGTPTVGFGPQGGAIGEPNEWIDRQEYLETVSALAAFLIEFDPST